MLGNDYPDPMLYIMDNSTISQIFQALYRSAFPSFWEQFDNSVKDGIITSVRPVRLELENARHPAIAQAPIYLTTLNRSFFEEPSAREQALVREMINDPDLSAASSRWRSKNERGTEDADPYLIAKARTSILPATVVTEESQDLSRTAGIYAVCHRFGSSCINLEQMMDRLAWQY